MKKEISEMSDTEFQILFNALTAYRQRGSVKYEEFEQISQLQNKIAEWWEAGFEEIGNDEDDAAAMAEMQAVEEMKFNHEGGYE